VRETISEQPNCGSCTTSVQHFDVCDRNGEVFSKTVKRKILDTFKEVFLKLVFLNRRAAARYRALVSVIPGRERFSWNLSFYFSKHFS